ncbi:MAG TPA: UDP binding domain-containing protein, partial [Candidatus Eremiobacteraceae bacterium]|nr:UDP binding domain-containing protein [Candidatus Eremiobacteraceae bacterium]
YETAIYDPVASGFKRPLSPTLDSALQDADALVLVVDHDVFRPIDPAKVGKSMRGRIVIDARNLFDPVKWERAGFELHTLGRPNAAHPKSVHTGERPKRVTAGMS